MRFNVIAAVCKDNGIGAGGRLPWSLPEDLRHFSKTTKGNGSNAIVMGRKTYESLPFRPLPGRANIVLSTEPGLVLETGVQLCRSVSEVVEHCESAGYETVWVSGGERVYKAFLDADLVDVCLITHIDRVYECDRWLPLLDPHKWSLRCARALENKRGLPVEVRQLVRIGHQVDAEALRL